MMIFLNEVRKIYETILGKVMRLKFGINTSYSFPLYLDTTSNYYNSSLPIYCAERHL